MAEARFLRRAPITEAIFDIRVPANPAISARTFDSLRNELAADFPLVEEPANKTARFRITAGRIASSTSDMPATGLHFKAVDGFTVAQFRADGFTLNRLKPYTSWDELFPQVARLWPKYVGLVSASSVSRIALRYINHLKLPVEPGEDFAEFLTAPVAIADGVPRRLSSFLTRVVVHDEESPATAVITQSLAGTTSGSVAAVLIDIDVSRTGGLPADIVALQPMFEELRQLKNRIFFASITERTARLHE